MRRLSTGAAPARPSLARSFTLAAAAVLVAPPLVAAPQTPDRLFRAVAEDVVDDDVTAVVETLRGHLDAIASGASDAPDPAVVAGLLAFAYPWIGAEFTEDSLRRALTEGLELPADEHDLRARLAIMTRDARALDPLVDWEFVGPLDNERGRSMGRRTSPERDPEGGPYEGKVVEVDWRALPTPSESGVHLIDRYVYPREQYCIVARTWVRAEGAREVALMLGASEEVRVWHDGAPVFEARGIHTFAPDAHAVRLQLREGWNEIALKIGAQDGSCQLFARLVDPETAAPVSLESAGAPPDGVAPAELADPGRRLRGGQGMVPPGAFAALEGRDSLDAALALAALRSYSCAGPQKERPGFEGVRAALEEHPESLAAVTLQLQLMRVYGALDVEEDINPWLTALRGAIERHGDRVRFMLAYTDHAVRNQGLPRRGMEFIDRALARRPDSVRALYNRMRLLPDVDLGALQRTEAAALSRQPDLANRPTVARDLASFFGAHEPERRRLLGIAAAAGDRPAVEMLRDLDMPGTIEEELQRVRADLDWALSDDPSRVGVRVWAGRLLVALGRTAEARRVLDGAVALSPDDPEVVGWRARAAIADGDLASAVADLEHVLDVDLSRTDDQRLVEHLRSRLEGGGAARVAEAEFHERFDEPLEDVVARHAPAEVAADAPREVLLRRVVVDVGPDGTARRYNRVVQRVLGPAGVKDLDRQGFRAYPGQEEVRILAARVYRPSDGSVREAETGRSGYRGGVGVDLPPLEVGDVVDIEWRRDDLVPSIFGDYFGLDTSLVADPSLPARESEVVVLERPGVDLTYNLAGAASGVTRDTRELEDGTTEAVFRGTPHSPRRREALEPPAAESLPRVQASTYASWEDFGRWWWSLIREEITASDEMREKVAELTAGKETPLEKLRAIYDFVVTDVRYNAWEFGIHGYQPYSAPVIFSRRFGDCKDKAILMKAMLAEAGIEAWPVVIRADGRRMEEDLSLAMVGHFNHCIAYVPAQEGVPEMFLDGTARLHPMEVLPSSDRGADVVVVRDDGVEIMEVPFPTADENLLVDEVRVDVAADGSADARIVRRPRGRWDPSTRLRYEGDAEQRAEAVERFMTQVFGALEGEATAEHADYQDLTRPIEVVFEARAEEVGRPTADGRELRAALFPQELLASLASETERETDLLLDVPWSRVQQLEYVLPEGASVTRVPDDVLVEGEDLRYSRDVGDVVRSADGRIRVRITERYALPNHRVPAARYAEFRELARRVDEAQRDTIEYTLEVR